MFKRNSLAINLLASTRFENTGVGKVFSWCLTIGKTIVFLTFALVMGIFVYRFSLDKKIDYLNDLINENSNTIQEYASVEPKIRELQTKLTSIDTLSHKQINTMAAFKFIESTLPTKAYLTSFIINEDLIIMKGSAENELIFSYFFGIIKKHPAVTELTISELTSGGVSNPKITFTMSVRVDPEKLKS